MSIVLIKTDSEFRALRHGWTRLSKRVPSASIFTTWEWMNTWWSVYGSSEDLRILVAVDEKEEPVGILPLRSQRRTKAGQTVSALSFVGDGSNDSDYLDAVIAPGFEASVGEAFRSHLKQELESGNVLIFNEMPESSSLMRVLASMPASGKLFTSMGDVPCSTVPLPATWEEYLGMLRPRFRTKVRSTLRALEARADVRFGFCDSTADIYRNLPILFDLHTRRWKEEGKPGVFGSERKREFYRALSNVLFERGWLRFSWLEWKGIVLAVQYGFVYNGVYSQLQEGYEPESEHWNPGIALRAYTIRHFIENGVREYDFLGGIGRHKGDWGSIVKHSKTVLMARRAPGVALFCYGPQIAASARQTAKNLLPEAVVSAARRILLKSASPKRVFAEHAGARPRFAARLYVSCGAPGAIRPIRDRYQLEAQDAIRGLRSLTKRERPSVRILYYHRVNDDRDPFFPSMSTRSFREHMQFVARHYRVVSLSEVPEQLAGNRYEPLLAITFDDGYQDNYVNAFPILKEFGLAATIFLTTGSIDTGEPLWFEQLATAIKQTEREFVDLEIDIPRRFGLRTQAERLAANSEIFGLLRTLNDAFRRDWLATIFRQLGADPVSERRNKMLSWDQIRSMNREKITFGGHTVTHPFISKLSTDEIAWEVQECKRRIEEEIQLPVYQFSYPNGKAEDFDDRNKGALRDAGYRTALTTLWGMNYADTDPMELRRGGPWEQDVAEFAYKLDWYQLIND